MELETFGKGTGGVPLKASSDPSPPLLQILKQIRAFRLGDRFERCLEGSLGSGQITDHGGQVRLPDDALLLRQVRAIAAEVGLLRGELVQGIAVKRDLRIDIARSSSDFRYGCPDGGSVTAL